MKFVIRVDSFNAPNNMTWADPSTSLGTKFGVTDNIRSNSYGRRTQLGGRIEW
jgi:hypothetical protein